MLKFLDMILSNPSFTFSPFEVDKEPDFAVLCSDGTIGKLPEIDSSLRAEDFNYSLQLSLGANLSFNSSYIPTQKLQDFESIISDADTMISQEYITKTSASQDNISDSHES